MASKLYQVVYDSILEGDTVLDLYCGTGSIGIFLSSKAGRVRGVEVNTQAILDAKQNKEMNGLDNVSFVCLDTSLFEEDLSCYDTIIVDPPRSGLNQKTISSLLDSNVKKIIYVSCDLMTLCRDLNVLKEKYEIKEVTPADLFPNTYHVESVCVLERK
jgi:23S rRNA (uracil1939-C5)-methyltransferase